ncbi:MAG: M48 family metalloprotease [Deltaproteobacteria bacterium]|nr:M48 family metalloprotease [Deltaproteobacteria bacterium]
MRRILAIVLAALMVAPPGVVPRALAQVAEEKKLGDEFLAKALPHMPLIHDYELAGFVREVGARLVKTVGPQPFDYEFFVVRDNEINAFAVPGGKLFVNAGLIARADNEDQLAGVMGHEIAHAAAHHVVRQQQKGAAAGYASLLGIFLAIINPALALGALAAGQAAQLRYQRDFEREADYLGIGYARSAGYDPSAIAQILKKLYAEQQLNPTQMPAYFMSHPLTGERLTNLEAVLGKTEWSSKAPAGSDRMHRAQAIARGYAQTREQCVPEYERALANATPAQRPEALELLGVLMTHGEDYELADQYLRDAETAGRNVDRELGRTEFRRGHLEEAKVRLGRALAKTPDDWDVLADLGNIDYQEGRYADAATKLDRSVHLEAYRAEVVQSLSRALAKTGKEGAAYYWQGRFSQMQGDPSQAMVHFRHSMELLPETDPLREDIVKRSKDLGEEIKEERAEKEQQQQEQRSRRGPGGIPQMPMPMPRSGGGR